MIVTFQPSSRSYFAQACCGVNFGAAVEGAGAKTSPICGSIVIADIRADAVTAPEVLCAIAPVEPELQLITIILTPIALAKAAAA
jgi:hypothetical protein